jgi:hypothetical protein
VNDFTSNRRFPCQAPRQVMNMYTSVTLGSWPNEDPLQMMSAPEKKESSEVKEEVDMRKESAPEHAPTDQWRTLGFLHGTCRLPAQFVKPSCGAVPSILSYSTLFSLSLPPLLSYAKSPIHKFF